MLFTTAEGDISRGATRTSIAALELATGRVKTILPGGTSPRFVSSGHLVYAEGGALRAVRFDPARLERIGDPVTVVPDVLVKVEGGALFDVTADGTLAYVPNGGATAGRQTSAVWVDRAGHETETDLPPRPYVAPRISPDGRQLALDVRGADSGIWLFELQRSALRKLTLDHLGRVPVWAPDGRAVAFSAPTEKNALNVYLQPVTGGQPARPLLASTQQGVPTSFSPDGSRLVFYAGTAAGHRDILVTSLSGGATQPLVQSPADELNGVVSPDGRWLAYESDERGRFEVYIRPFAGGSDERWLASDDGGTRPVWTRGGRELIYLAPNGFLMSVALETTGRALSLSPAVRLFDTARYYTGSVVTRTFDVTPDGSRFLMLKVADPTTDTDIVIVRNWTKELTRLMERR
jgi:serine/threonine-protein kinase